jgi:elongation factor P
MLSIKDIKSGKKIILEEQPFTVLTVQHSKMGRMGAVLRTKLKNLETGALVTKTFQGSDKVKEAEVDTKKAQYLYQDGDTFYFMDNESYEQFELGKKIIGDDAKYLKEGVEVSLLYFDERIINIELPIKMTFEVIEAPPAVKGNTADGGSKQVTIETGAQITTPLFIKQGDKIKVNTTSGEYAEKG